jgi:NAD(P)-dependent dehydrogenase (short-subunit alcohol dehydrogenase family)
VKKQEFSTGAAFVTGGTGGIGAAICRELAASGANVAFTYRSKAEAAAALEAELKTFGVEAKSYKLDLLDTDMLQATVESAVATFGHLHSVVYASGPALEFLYIHEITPMEWARVINGDANACFNLIHATLPHLRSRRSGSYVAITTAAVDHAPPRDILSAAPKAAIEMLVKGVAREEGRNGIRANCVRPGFIRAGLGISTTHEGTQDYVDRMIKAVPLKRTGEAEDVAGSTVFLLSQKASYVSGVSIAVAGGLQLV